MYGGGGYPAYYPPPAPPRKKSCGCARCFCRCLGCFFCFFIVLILINLLSVVFFVYAYDPRVPSYHVENIDVKSFDMKPNSSILTTNIHVAIRAQNPNKNIEFIYGDNSELILLYSDVRICAGKLPPFRHGHEITAILEANLSGNARIEESVLEKFMENEKNHNIPLMLKMKVPINVIVSNVKLKEFRASVNCAMVVDGLYPGKPSRIIVKETVFALEE